MILELNPNLGIIRVQAESPLLISNIYIDTQRTFNCIEEPSINALNIPVSEEECIYDEEENMYKIDKEIYINNYPTLLISDISDTFFIVFVQSGYTYFYDYVYDTRIVKDYVFNAIYKSVIKDNSCNCNTDYSIIDLLLLYNGLELSSSIKDKLYFWNLLHKNNSIHNCTCNGR